jgi:oligoribonuclease NrnB/cAMP/cGMP phosphodiesterase (DHH superfamily)
MIIIYHSRDLDGWTSGAILKARFPHATLIGYDYGQPIPIVPNEEDVIMVDVSMKMPELFAFAARMRSFTWIDHHISAINEFREYEATHEHRMATVLQDGLAACELAWGWAFMNLPLPPVVLLLGMYDTWRNGDQKYWNERIMPFQYGMRAMCQSPESFPTGLFSNLEEGEIDEIIHMGKIILDYQKEQDTKAAKGAFTFEWQGHRIIALNGGGFNSNAFKSVYDPDVHDIMMPFKWAGTYWVFSLYTEKVINCSAIAEKFGGGGHKKAAGFQLTKFADGGFPFTI